MAEVGGYVCLTLSPTTNLTGHFTQWSVECVGTSTSAVIHSVD